MKRSNKDESIVHYVPEFYNDNINDRTGKEYGWIPCEEFKKPYTARKWAEEAIAYRRRYDKSLRCRLRIEQFVCTDVSFEEI